MTRVYASGFLILITLALASCSPPERPDLTLQGSGITSNILEEIETLTRLELPEDTEGLHYLYVRSGTRPAMQAKLKLPAEARAGVLKSLKEAEVREQPMPALAGEPWWQPSLLKEPVHHEWDVPAEEHARSSIGMDEEGNLILYLTWFPG